MMQSVGDKIRHEVERMPMWPTVLLSAVILMCLVCIIVLMISPPKAV